MSPHLPMIDCPDCDGTGRAGVEFACGPGVRCGMRVFECLRCQGRGVVVPSREERSTLVALQPTPHAGAQGADEAVPIPNAGDAGVPKAEPEGRP